METELCVFENLPAIKQQNQWILYIYFRFPWRILQYQKVSALKDAIFLQKIADRMKMGPGIVKPAHTIVRITVAANKAHPGRQHNRFKK